MSGVLLLGAAAASVAALVHGVVGHRWMSAQLSAVQLPASDLFGDADVARRVFTVTWHVVTAVFAVTAGAFALAAAGAVESRALLLLVAALHAAFLVVGLVVFARRLDAVLTPVPPVFAACMTTVTVTAALAARA